MAAWESIRNRGLMGENRNIPIGRVCTLEATESLYCRLGVVFCCHVSLIGVWDSQGTHETQLMISEAENFLSCLFSVIQYF